MGDAIGSGFVLVTATAAAVVLEAAMLARHRRRARRPHGRPDVERIPWREMERYR